VKLSWFISFRSIALVCFLFSFGMKVKAGGPGDHKKDTATAVVAYGDEYLFQAAIDPTDNLFSDVIDSVLQLDTIPPTLLKRVQFFRDIRYKNEEEIFAIVDSLFELDTVPYGLINQINLFVAVKPEHVPIPEKFTLIPDDGSPYPANSIYHHWNNRAAFDYPASLSENDSSFVLKLVDEEHPYHHPLGQKSLRRYFGTVTSPYGWRDGRNHNGVDLELHYYDSIFSMFSGVVRMARNYAGFGKVVVVRHQNGLETLYAHMSRFRVHEGDSVVAGQLLGHGGQTGNATGTHLHMEIRYKGVPLNPAHIIDFTKRELYADVLEMHKFRRTFIAYPYGTEFHTVRRGDYPYRIAKRYGIPIDKFCAMNGITKHTKLVVGNQVKVVE